jgi:hypothetical protein
MPTLVIALASNRRQHTIARGRIACRVATCRSVDEIRSMPECC